MLLGSLVSLKYLKISHSFLDFALKEMSKPKRRMRQATMPMSLRLAGEF